MNILTPGTRKKIEFYDTRQYRTVCGENSKKFDFLDNALLAIKQPGTDEQWTILEDYSNTNKYPLYTDSTYIIYENTYPRRSELNKECLKLLPVVQIEFEVDEFGEVSTVMNARSFPNLKTALQFNDVKESIYDGDDSVENLALFNLVPKMLPDFMYKYNPLQFDDKTRFFIYLAMIGGGIYGANQAKNKKVTLLNGSLMGCGIYGAVQVSKAFIRNPGFVKKIF